MMMDIRKFIALCPTCMPSHHVCLPFPPPISPPWLSSNGSGMLAEDGGISLADYSPHGDLLCELSDITISDRDSVPSDDCSLRDGSFRSSNEALADKSLSTETSLSPCSSVALRKLSTNSSISNEAEAIGLNIPSTCDSSDSSCCSICDSSFLSHEIHDSLQSFAGTLGGGEGLAEDLSSCDTSHIVDSLDSLGSTPTSANIDSISLPASSPLSPQIIENDLSK